MLTIARIVDNDSVGTKVQLSDGSFSNVAHGGPAPSIGQAVDVKEFGYCIPVEGTRPHQMVDMAAAYDTAANDLGKLLSDMVPQVEDESIRTANGVLKRAAERKQ